MEAILKGTQFKLSICPAVERSFDFIDFIFDTEIELHAAADTAARLLLYLQDDLRVMPDLSNMFEKFKKDPGGEWEELDEVE
jgi:hypothetical protein